MTAIIAAHGKQEGWNSRAYALHFGAIKPCAGHNAKSPRLRAFRDIQYSKLRAMTVRAIDLSVMIEIMLAIMFLAVDTLAFNVLGMLQARALLAGYHAIRLGLGFHLVDMTFLTFKTLHFAPGQRARFLALLDAAFLIGLTLIDVGGLRRLRERGQRQRGNDGSHKQLGLHLISPVQLSVWDIHGTH